jgi:predicted nucleic acid-binding protein
MYLLDTNTVIDFCNSKLPESARISLSAIAPSISFISQIELFSSSNISISEKQTLEDFIRICTVYNHITDALVRKTIGIRQQHKTKLPDALIAATALLYDLTLITRNITDFKSITGLSLMDSYQIHYQR